MKLRFESLTDHLAHLDRFPPLNGDPAPMNDLETPPVTTRSTTPAMTTPTAMLTVRGLDSLLRGLGVAALTVMAVGQLVFASYVLAFYGGALLQGAPQRWNQILPKGHVVGDTLGNGMLGLHLLAAVVFVVAGVLQLLPAVRRRVPALHRWSGRSYLVLAAMLALGGLWLVWVRQGVAGDRSQHLAITVNAVLILVCSWRAWGAARRRDLATHRRWAIRLYLVASGVWFFRVGLMAWLALHQAPVGFDPKTFSGPFLTSLAIVVYVAGPLSVAQAYFGALQARRRGVKLAAALWLLALQAVLVIGVFAASAGLWIPRVV